ncbi:MAG: hypothetical protein N3F65_03140 [Nitrososphaeria archaeon]|nr:hypothetical protein [Aigarchaeota archaeon]MCX8187586.1 hypothetical protein [Nitrososphaeria archaeon]MDW8021280.1 hypothetical protein [Nitrososphaerota archaeon]
MGKRETAPLKIQVSSFEELILMTSFTRFPVLNIDEEEGVAFSFIMVPSLTPIIYFCKLDKVPDAKFVHINKITGRIRFGNELSTEPNEDSILLVRTRFSGLLSGE